MNCIFDLHRVMMKQKLILVYEGAFTQESTKSILSMAERSLEAAEEDAGIKRKVFNVMVEALQNVVKHNDHDAYGVDHSRSAIFLIGKESNRYTIMTGNPVHKDKVKPLASTLEKINGLDRDGLKNLYKDTIQDTTISDKGGAGLGFLDMARKSGEKLWFDFPQLSDAYCLFCLKVKIIRELQELY